MWLKWLPWRFLISRLARSQGFLDPLALLSRLHRFAQPSEVTEPIELLRAGVLFHARGLLNTRTLQHNLDWVWPFWVERQFNPRTRSFIPRAFSITHVNLTHRNWTAVGLPDCDRYPIVDPRGLVTPLYDGWSLDAWILTDSGCRLLPAREPRARQRLRLGENLRVETHLERDEAQLTSTAEMIWHEGQPWLQWHVQGRAREPGWLAVAVRPANPEGVSFIQHIEANAGGRELLVHDDKTPVRLDPAPQRICMSEYRRGDVLLHLDQAPAATQVTCDVGLATAAALYRLDGDSPSQVQVRVPLGKGGASETQTRSLTIAGEPIPWRQALAGACRLRIPDRRMQFLYRAALRTLVLHAPEEVYPGPYTYRRFWFRDAAFILEALLQVGLFERVRRVLEKFPTRQTAAGYFLSQEGEWDSNGAALWILDRYCRLSGQPLSTRLLEAVRSGAEWLGRKRLSDTLPQPHAGLLPAGFSAEHLGPNDFYYWDDFWAAGGLRAAATMLRDNGDRQAAEQCEGEAGRYLAAIERSLCVTAATRRQTGLPASPYRRMDAGAVGSLAAGYPLRLFDADDPRLLATADFLYRRCLVRGGFFQDMIHSGINAYLTLHLAQVFLRAGDSRYWSLIEAVARLASPTGQWPEAIHPRTRGGCMGDGQHVWAAAEWIMMMRSLFVREEGDCLLIGTGLPRAWLQDKAALHFGPTATPYGRLCIRVLGHTDGVTVRWHGRWHGASPRLRFALPGHVSVEAQGDQGTLEINRAPAMSDYAEKVT